MNKPEYELSDEDILDANPCEIGKDCPVGVADETSSATGSTNLKCKLCEKQSVARASRKKLVEWLWEYCAEHGQWRRLLCPKCWQNLKKELGVKS